MTTKVQVVQNRNMSFVILMLLLFLFLFLYSYYSCYDFIKGKEGAPIICFNASKKETHHPNSVYKKLARSLRNDYQIVVLVLS